MAFVAAAPKYLQDALSDLSRAQSPLPPGHLFNLYFPAFESDSYSLKSDGIDKAKGKNQALNQLSLENKASAELVSHLRKRQSDQMLKSNSVVTIEAISISPFATGLGLEHPLENGFAFLNPYGVAYLPGSSIKGVLRNAARDLSQSETSNWSDLKIYRLNGQNTASPQLSMLDILFGLESDDNGTDHFRGVLTFHDVIVQLHGNKLVIEIMTPHQSHYLQGTETPHDSGQPNPIKFLAVPPQSKFDFHISCDVPRLKKIAAPLVSTWRESTTELLHHAFDWLGFGAKTTVGYGAMREDPELAKRKALMQREQQERDIKLENEQKRAQEIAQLSPALALAAKEFDARLDKNQTELACLFNGLKKGVFNGEHILEVAQYVMELLKRANKWKERTEKKNPEKDSDYQDTLLVKKWIEGK